MGGRVAKRVLLAPVVVVIATTAVPPATATFSPLNEWFTKAAPASIEIASSLSDWLAAAVPLTDAPRPAERMVIASADVRDVKQAAGDLDVTALTRAREATLPLLNGWRATAVPVTVAVLTSANDWLTANVPPLSVAISFQSDALTDGPRPTERPAVAAAELPQEKPAL